MPCPPLTRALPWQALIVDQLKCIKNPSNYCRWHPQVLAWCSNIYLQNATVYETLGVAGVLKLPSASARGALPAAAAVDLPGGRHEIGKLADELGLEEGRGVDVLTRWTSSAASRSR